MGSKRHRNNPGRARHSTPAGPGGPEASLTLDWDPERVVVSFGVHLYLQDGHLLPEGHIHIRPDLPEELVGDAVRQLGEAVRRMAAEAFD